MAEREARIAKCDEMLAFLAEHDAHLKLRRLTTDIKQLRDDLIAERPTAREASSDSPSEATS
jgi:hypothetical protein